MFYRTDMAVERRDIYREANKLEDEIPGVDYKEERFSDTIKVTRVKILDEQGEQALQKKRGVYTTIDVKRLNNITVEEEDNIINVVSNELKAILDKHIVKQDEVLIIGLGNLYSTPDSLGNKVVKNIEITRHIKKYFPQYIDSGERAISAICPGVLGTTGIETFEIVKGLVENVKPKMVLAIDSLASKSIERISNSIQISDTGIVPGGGVRNARQELTEESLGIPVVSLGVPTTLDAATIVIDTLKMCNEANIQEKEIIDKLTLNNFNFIVTPKEIDEQIEAMSEIIGDVLNKTL